jgi:hypothetical protein
MITYYIFDEIFACDSDGLSDEQIEKIESDRFEKYKKLFKVKLNERFPDKDIRLKSTNNAKLLIDVENANQDDWTDVLIDMDAELFNSIRGDTSITDIIPD